MPTHSHRLMGSDAEIRSRPSGARQNKTGIFILREESDGIALIHLSGFESPSASETPSLMTERREREALAKSRVPYVLILRHLNRPIPRRSSQQHIELSPGFVLLCSLGGGPPPSTRAAGGAGVVSFQYRTTGSCCREHAPVRHGGNGRSVRTSHRAHRRAAR